MPTTINDLKQQVKLDPDFVDELANYLETPDMINFEDNNYLEVNGTSCTIWFDEEYNAHLSNVEGIDCDIIIDY